MSDIENILTDLTDDFQDFIDDQMDHIDGLVDKIITAITVNSGVSGEKIIELAKQLGFTLSDSLLNFIKNGNNTTDKDANAEADKKSQEDSKDAIKQVTDFAKQQLKHVIEYTDIIKAFEKVKEKLKNKSDKGHQHGNADITDIDASKIKSGTIDIDRLPKGAIERMVYVKDDAARFALTTNTTQNGDTVKVRSTKKMFYVIDDTKLSSEAGYELYTAESASAVPWSGVTGKPTTFTPEAHTHAISDVADLQETLTGLRQDVNAKPSKDTNTTYSLIQDSTDGHKLTFKGSDGSTKTVTIPDNDHNDNTWRDVVDSLDSARTDASLSANQGRVLNGKFGGYLPLHGTADIAASVTDYGDTAKHIQIGFSGAGITGDDIKYIAGYTGGDGGNLSAKIKDISKDALKAWLGLGSRAYDSTNYLPSNGGDLDGTLHVKPTTGSYTEGMRVYPYEGWSTVMLNGTDNTGTSGTSPKSWGLFNNDGQFYITKNGANTSPTAIFSNTDGTWRANGHELITAGNIGSQNVNYANSAGSANSVAWGNVSGRPTALSSFTNDKGYINGITKAMVTDALGYTPPTSDTNTTYSAGTGLNLSGTAFSVKYGSAAGTACQGNDSRLSNARPASDVYSWAKASSKPSYTWTEISNKPDIPSISKYTPTRTNWTINSEYNCVVYRIGDFCLAVVTVTGTIYPRQWLPAAQLSKDFTPKIQSSIVVCSVSGSDHMECMVTKDGYIKMWWSGSSPATSANICVPYYMG